MENDERQDQERDPRSIALGRRIERRRKALRLTQQQFADRLGRHKNTIGSWERGEKNLQAVDALDVASALRITLDQLLGARSEVLGLTPNRRERVYLLRRSEVARVLAAKSIEELRDLFNVGIDVGHEIEEDAEEVTAEEWGRETSKVDAKILELGSIPRKWAGGE